MPHEREVYSSRGLKILSLVPKSSCWSDEEGSDEDVDDETLEQKVNDFFTVTQDADIPEDDVDFMPVIDLVPTESGPSEEYCLFPELNGMADDNNGEDQDSLSGGSRFPKTSVLPETSAELPQLYLASPPLSGMTQDSSLMLPGTPRSCHSVLSDTQMSSASKAAKRKCAKAAPTIPGTSDESPQPCNSTTKKAAKRRKVNPTTPVQPDGGLVSPKPSSSAPKMVEKKKRVRAPTPTKPGRVTVSTRITLKTRDPKKKKIGFRWKRRGFIRRVDLPKPKIRKVRNQDPLEYFMRFFTDELLDMIVEQSILYSVQKDPSNPSNITQNDLKDFLAVQIFMGLARMNSYKDYWSDELRYDRVADIMPRRKYESIRQVLHFANNQNDTNEDKFYKIRPVFEYLRQKFISCDGDEKKYAVDEMMIKYKGRKAGSRKQYMPKKPIKWGFKLFGRSGASGFVYDMYTYSGDETLKNVTFEPNETDITFSGKIVLALCQSIPSKPLSAVFIDNWFNSPLLMYTLRKNHGILSLGTLREDRLVGGKEVLKSDKILAKGGRGTMDSVCDNKKNVILVRWNDTKVVTLGSSYVGVDPVSKIKRFCKQAKKRVDVSCPALVLEYNRFMGGIDKSDMLVAIFKTPLKSFKWYMNIFSYLIDLSLCNAFILYRRDTDIKIGLKKFKYDVSVGLRTANRKKMKKTKYNRKEAPLPSSARYDQLGHFPSYASKGKCRHCHVGQTRWQCSKCNVRLCLNNTNNCFLTYHTEATDEIETDI